MPKSRRTQAAAPRVPRKRPVPASSAPTATSGVAAETPGRSGARPGVISVIIPTIEARAGWLERCAATYEHHTPNVEVIPVRDKRSCGEAWIAGAELATGEYLHFTADDLEPLGPEWWVEAVQAIDAGHVPAANVLSAKLRSAWGPSEDWDPASTMNASVYLHDGTTQQNVLVPFLSRKQLDAARYLLPIHYGSDDWVTFVAHFMGLQMPFLPSYLLGHGAAPEGRLYDSRQRDIPILVEAMQDLAGAVPQPYVDMALSNGWSPGREPPKTRPVAQLRGRRANVVTPAPTNIATPPLPTAAPGYYWNGPSR